MLRAFALSLSLSTLCAIIALPARAEPVPPPPALRLAELSPSWGSPRLSALSVASAYNQDAKLTDEWVLRMTEARARREHNARWAVPLMLGGAAAMGAAFAVLPPDISSTSRLLFGVSALLPAALIVPAALAAPPNKSRWLALGGFLFSASFSAAGIVLATEQTGCSGWCGNERAVGWLTAGFIPATLLLGLAFVDRGPTLQELEDYARLPPDNRAVAGRKLIARIDRAERKALAIEAAIDLLALGILATGAAVVQDGSEQKLLLGFGGAGYGIHSIFTFVTLLSPTRLEKLALGRRPEARERVFW